MFDFNYGLVKPLLRLGHGWVITSYNGCIFKPYPNLNQSKLIKGPVSYVSNVHFYNALEAIFFVENKLISTIFIEISVIMNIMLCNSFYAEYSSMVFEGAFIWISVPFSYPCSTSTRWLTVYLYGKTKPRPVCLSVDRGLHHIQRVFWCQWLSVMSWK